MFDSNIHNGGRGLKCLVKAREERKGREKTQTGRFQIWFGFTGRWIFNSIAHEWPKSILNLPFDSHKLIYSYRTNFSMSCRKGRLLPPRSKHVDAISLNYILYCPHKSQIWRYSSQWKHIMVWRSPDRFSRAWIVNCRNINWFKKKKKNCELPSAPNRIIGSSELSPRLTVWPQRSRCQVRLSSQLHPDRWSPTVSRLKLGPSSCPHQKHVDRLPHGVQAEYTHVKSADLQSQGTVSHLQRRNAQPFSKKNASHFSSRFSSSIPNFDLYGFTIYSERKINYNEWDLGHVMVHGWNKLLWPSS